MSKRISATAALGLSVVAFIYSVRLQAQLIDIERIVFCPWQPRSHRFSFSKERSSTLV